MNTIVMQKLTMSHCREGASLAMRTDRAHSKSPIFQQDTDAGSDLMSKQDSDTLESLPAVTAPVTTICAVPTLMLLTCLPIWNNSKIPHTYGHQKSYSMPIHATSPDMQQSTHGPVCTCACNLGEGDVPQCKKPGFDYLLQGLPNNLAFAEEGLSDHKNALQRFPVSMKKVKKMGRQWTLLATKFRTVFVAKKLGSQHKAEARGCYAVLLKLHILECACYEAATQGLLLRARHKDSSNIFNEKLLLLQTRQCSSLGS